MKQSNLKLLALLFALTFTLSACASGQQQTVSEGPGETAETVQSGDAGSAETQTIQLGTTAYSVQLPNDFEAVSVSDEDAQDDMITAYYSASAQVRFSVYQFSKDGYPDTLEDFVEQESKDYAASELVTGDSLNGIEVGYYRATGELNGAPCDNLTYAFEDGGDYVEIDFMFAGPDAESVVQAILHSLSAG